MLSLCHPHLSLNAREGVLGNWDNKIPEIDLSGPSRFPAVWTPWWQSPSLLLKVIFCYCSEKNRKVTAMYVLYPALLGRWRGVSLRTSSTPSSLVARVIFL